MNRFRDVSNAETRSDVPRNFLKLLDAERIFCPFPCVGRNTALRPQYAMN